LARWSSATFFYHSHFLDTQ